MIADDRFVPLATWGKLGAEQALLVAGAILDGEAGYFTSKEFENLGGVALFKQEIEMDLFPEVSEKPLRCPLSPRAYTNSPKSRSCVISTGPSLSARSITCSPDTPLEVSESRLWRSGTW